MLGLPENGLISYYGNPAGYTDKEKPLWTAFFKMMS